MNNEIDDKVADMIQVLVHDANAVLISSYADDRVEVLRQDIIELENYIAALETAAAKFKWQTGHPEHEGEYWVVAQHDDGSLYFGIDAWVIGKNYSMWKWSGRHEDETGEPLSGIVAWQEIPPFDLEMDGE